MSRLFEDIITTKQPIEKAPKATLSKRGRGRPPKQITDNNKENKTKGKLLVTYLTPTAKAKVQALCARRKLDTGETITESSLVEQALDCFIITNKIKI